MHAAITHDRMVHEKHLGLALSDTNASKQAPITMHLGQVGHNDTLPQTEFFRKTFTPKNVRLIHTLSPSLRGRHSKAEHDDLSTTHFKTHVPIILS